MNNDTNDDQYISDPKKLKTFLEKPFLSNNPVLKAALFSSSDSMLLNKACFLDNQMKSFLSTFTAGVKLNTRIIQKRYIRLTITRYDDDNDKAYDEILKGTGVQLKLPQGKSYIGTSTSSIDGTGSNISGHNVFVIHPKIRWGSHSASVNTTPELQLEEAVSLVRTIPGFNVVT